MGSKKMLIFLESEREIESYYLIYVKILRPTRSISQVLFMLPFCLSTCYASFLFVNQCRICLTANSLRGFFTLCLLNGIFATALLSYEHKVYTIQRKHYEMKIELQRMLRLMDSLINNIFSSWWTSRRDQYIYIS